jgi:hypothetical protein
MGTTSTLKRVAGGVLQIKLECVGLQSVFACIAATQNAGELTKYINSGFNIGFTAFGSVLKVPCGLGLCF